MKKILIFLPVFLLFGCSTGVNYSNKPIDKGNQRYEKLQSFMETKKNYITDISFTLKDDAYSLDNHGADEEEQKQISLSEHKTKLQTRAISYVLQQFVEKELPHEYTDVFRADLESLVVKHSDFKLLGMQNNGRRVLISSKITINLNRLQSDFIGFVEKSIASENTITEQKRVIGYYLLAQLYKGVVLLEEDQGGKYMHYLKMAAKYKLKEAQFDLGLIYLKGDINKNIVSDKTESIYWLRKSLENNNYGAAVVLYLLQEQDEAVLIAIKEKVDRELFKKIASYM